MSNPGSLEGYYKNMAEQWREAYVAAREENGELRKRVPGAPGLYRARQVDGALLVERVFVPENGVIVLDAKNLGF
jgi:hypothetical protein